MTCKKTKRQQPTFWKTHFLKVVCKNFGFWGFFGFYYVFCVHFEISYLVLLVSLVLFGFCLISLLLLWKWTQQITRRTNILQKPNKPKKPIMIFQNAYKTHGKKQKKQKKQSFCKLVSENLVFKKLVFELWFFWESTKNLIRKIIRKVMRKVLMKMIRKLRRL